MCLPLPKNDRVIERMAPKGTGDINKKAFLEGRSLA